MVRPPFWLRANGEVRRVAAGPESGAATCYWEVAVDDCYGLFAYASRAQPRVIADVGANVGIFSTLCSMLFPEAAIDAYEPNPAALVWLRQNAARTRIQVHPVAVGEAAGMVKLDTTYDSTVGRVWDGGDYSVRCISASDIAEGRAIDLLKIDCEGSEWSVLRDPSLLARSRDCRLEYHLIDGHTEADLRSLFEQGRQLISVWHRTSDGRSGVIHSTRRH